MKTSILISGFAALYLVIAFAESPSHTSADKNNAGQVDHISFVPVNQVSTASENKLSLKTTKGIAETTPVLIREDFGYLKFNVADYTKAVAYAPSETELLPALPEPDCSYLRFDITVYTANTEVSSSDDLELPVNDFDYLRFNVDKYTETNTDSFANMEIPDDNFRYLKFYVNEFGRGSEMEAGTIDELPVTETQPYCSL